MHVCVINHSWANCESLKYRRAIEKEDSVHFPIFSSLIWLERRGHWRAAEAWKMKTNKTTSLGNLVVRVFKCNLYVYNEKTVSWML